MSIASALNHGRILYVTAWDHHTFLDILLFQGLFSVLPSGAVPFAVRILNMLTVGMLCLIAVHGSSRLMGKTLWGWSAALWIAFLTGEEWALSSYGEFYHSLPVTAAFFLYFCVAPSPPRLMSVGFLLAVGFLIKQTAVFDIVTLVVLAILRSRIMTNPSNEEHRQASAWPLGRQCIWISIGAGAVGVCALAYFQFNGGINEALYMSFIDPWHYATGTDASATWAKYFTTYQNMASKIRTLGIFHWFTGYSLLLLAASLVIRKREIDLADYFGAGVVIWLVIDMLGIISIGRFYAHYLIQLIVPGAFLAAFLFVKLAREWQLGVLVGQASLIVISSLARLSEPPQVLGSNRTELAALATIVKTHVSRDEGIFLYRNWDVCLYYLCERFPPCKVFMDGQLLPENKDGPPLLREVLASLEYQPPKAVIKGSLGYSIPEIEDFVTNRYTVLTNVGGHTILLRD